MVKNTLPFLGTLPFFLMSLGLIRTKASSSKTEKALNAWSAKIFLSAKNKILGLRCPSLLMFHFA
jgi:hypothetical protein